MKETFYQVKATFGGKSKTPGVRVKGFSYQGLVVAHGKKPTQEQIKELVLKNLDVRCQFPDVEMTEKVEIKKIKMEFLFNFQ